jgi:ABC-type glycerol-3-phosphate transport system substrate-binding protein
MTLWKSSLTGTAIAVLCGTTAMADCGITAGNVQILGNEFPAIQAVVAGAAECGVNGVTVGSNLTTEHRDIQVAALTANPAQYSVAIVANSSIVPLMNGGLIRPLDDLVAAHGDGLRPNQLITVNGQVMAVAFMANAQHLFVRQDILDQIGMAAPVTYEDVIAVAAAVREAGIMEYPFSTNTMTGWNLGEEFINMYMATGADFFVDGTAAPAINNENGIAALEMLKALTAYSNPDFLTFDSNATAALWENGEAAVSMMWGTRAGTILDDEGSSAEVVNATILTSAPLLAGSAIPATTLWWDGFTIAANVSDEDAEASFIAMMNGIRPEIVTANSDSAVWLGEGYEPTASAAGVFASVTAGAKPYPMMPFMGLLHTALGENLAEFLQGSESAEQALADVEATYTTAARGQGFLQ